MGLGKRPKDHQQLGILLSYRGMKISWYIFFRSEVAGSKDTNKVSIYLFPTRVSDRVHFLSEIAKLHWTLIIWSSATQTIRVALVNVQTHGFSISGMFQLPDEMTEFIFSKKNAEKVNSDFDLYLGFNTATLINTQFVGAGLCRACLNFND